MKGLEISGLVKSFGGVHAVRGLSLAARPGELIGFLGPNGAGKTTTMRAVVGMVEPDAGSITWNGSPVGPEVRRRIGYMPQERGLYARMNVREQIVYFGRLAGLTKSVAEERAGRWIDRLGIAERDESLVQELSGGNQQRVQLAVSLVHDPDLLILDEPFAGLDPVAAETMQEIVTERAQAGTAVVFSSHQLDLVEGLVDRVVVAADGELVASGQVAELRSASPERVLKIRWSDPLDGFQPLSGTVLKSTPKQIEVRLDASSDQRSQVAHALAAGPVDSISLEPPELSEIFGDLVEDRQEKSA